MENKQNSFEPNSFKPNAFAEIIESSCSKFLAQTWNHQGEPSLEEPRLGNLVEAKTNNIIILGIITSIQTGSQDPMRYPFTYQKTEEELKKEQPQIFEFLKTTFDVQIIGTQPVTKSLPSFDSAQDERVADLQKPNHKMDFENKKNKSLIKKTPNPPPFALSEVEGLSEYEAINYSLPSSPPKIHSFVKNANIDTIKNFFSKTDFLSLLFNAQISNLDEILLTILKNLKTINKTIFLKTGLKQPFLNKFCSDFALLSGNDYKRLKLFLKRVQAL